MKLLSFFVKYSRGTVILAIIAGVVSGACNTGLLAIINSALRRQDSRLVLLWWFIALCLLLPLTRFISEILLTKLGQGALYDLRMRLSRQILAAPLRHLEELGPHKVLATLTEDVPAITGAVLIIPLLCINAAVVIGCLIYLGWLSWVLLLAVLFFMAVGIASYQLPIIKALRSLRLAREEGDALMGHFRALTDGAKELKLHGRRRGAFFSQVLEPTAAAFRRHNVSGMTVYTAAASWGQALVFVVVGLVLFAMPAFQQLDVLRLTGYVIVLLYMMNPLQVIMNMAPTIGRANVSIRKVEELGLSLSTHEADHVNAELPERAPKWHSLELVNVTHAYHRDEEDRDFILGPVNLTFRPGELVYIVGGNGSGKTTLAKLVVGLYSPESGEIRLDGKPVTEENKEQYRQLFSVVFSDFYLFDSLLGLDAPQLDERARQYLEKLQLQHKARVEGGALSTVDLSQGQRKRLALLTAYLEDRPIYLFDEWAADQDPLFKNVFYLQILPELQARGKTVLVISHDDRYYHLGDRMIKLDYGKVEYDEPVTPTRAMSAEAPVRS
ncbi:MAG: cyclic peptide export ABC transporter [Acidobacteriota bacterium]|nr:cyclic peptide export ABC transporter [Acidobacteriota bacterium]